MLMMMHDDNYNDEDYEDGNAADIFYSGYSDVFATCSKNDIRVWNTNTCKELLRITVPNMDCNTVAISVDGKSIVSGESSCNCTPLMESPLILFHPEALPNC